MLPMEKSRYRAKATAWDLGEASTGTPQVAVEFEVTEGEQKGERITWYGFLTDAAADRSLKSLRICGWAGNDLGDGLPGLDANVVEIVCEPEDSLPDKETGDVTERLRVQWVNKAGGIAMKTRMTDDQKRAIAAKMRGKLATIDALARRDGSAPPPPVPTNGQAAGAPTGAVDDIPF